MTNKEKSIQMYKSGVKIKDIATKMQLNVSTIHAHLKGVERTSRSKITVKDITDLVSENYNVKDICSKLNISYRTYYEYMSGKSGVLKASQMLKEQVIEMYKNGITPKQISEQLSISQSTVFTKLKGVEKTQKKIVEKSSIEALLNKGYSVDAILSELGINIKTYYNHIKGDQFKRGAKELDQKVIDNIIRLRGSGIGVKEVSKMLNIGYSTIVKHSKHLGVKAISKQRVKVDEPKTIVMKKAKQIIPLEISRDNLQKGLEKGVAYIETTLSENRDCGRLVKIKYSTIGNIPSKILEIRVKDDVSDMVACERFAKRNNFKSWAVC